MKIKLRPAPGVSSDEVRRHLGEALDPELALGFSPIPLPADAPVSQQGHDRLDGCVLTLSFTSADPAEPWDEQRAAAARLETDGIGQVLWTAPFIPTVPGTDTYTDQLW